MPMKKEKFQYTFRVGQTYRQYMQMAYTEEEGKNELAETLLRRENVTPESASYPSKFKELVAQLHLVQKR